MVHISKKIKKRLPRISTQIHTQNDERTHWAVQLLPFLTVQETKRKPAVKNTNAKWIKCFIAFRSLFDQLTERKQVNRAKSVLPAQVRRLKREENKMDWKQRMDVRPTWESFASKHYKVETFFLHVIYSIFWHFSRMLWGKERLI